MGVQKCQHCGKDFEYKDIQKSIWGGYKPMECNHCGSLHEFLMRYRLLVSVLIALPIFFSGYLRRMSPGFLWTTFIYFGYITLTIGVLPYIVRYRLRLSKLD